MKERKFKIGDRVRIRPESSYNHQCSDIGTVVVSDSSRGWINVDFDNGYQNSYPSEDLYFDEPSTDQEFHVGDQVQITQGSENWDTEMNQYVGKIATIKGVRWTPAWEEYIYQLDIDDERWNWWPSKGHFIHAPQHGMDQKDELLYRAEQMFPVGTKFCPAHQMDEFKIQKKVHCIITNDTSFMLDEGGNIFAKANGRNWFPSEHVIYGNTTYDRVIYMAREKKWAHIYPTVEKEEPQEDDKPVPVDDIMVIEAKKRYPVGTRFYPAHQEYNVGDSEYCIMTDDTKIEVDRNGTIYAAINGSWWDATGNPKYGNTTWNRVLWDADDDTWATVLKEVQEFKIGDKVMITRSENNWCPEMDEFIGKIATLVKTKGSKGTHFAIDLDKGEWAWSDKDGHFRKPTKEELATTEDECTPKIDWKPTTSDSYLKQELDKVTVSMSDITQVYTDSTGRIRHTWSTSTPVVEELPTFRVKKVSFNRI